MAVTDHWLPPVAVTGQRDLTGWIGLVARVLAIALPLITLIVAFTGSLDTMTRRAGHLAIAIPLVFLFLPARRGGPARPTASDLALAVLAAVAFGWLIVDRQRIMWRLVYVDPLSWTDLLLGVAAILLVFEATRRTLGWTLVVVALVFVGYALAGPVMPGLFEHKGVRFTTLVEHLYLVPEGLFNMVTGVMATYLLVFLLFGSLLRFAGGERLFTDITMASTRQSAGGPAKASVFGSLLIGTVTGSTIATVVTAGTITIPLMKRAGFRPHEAAAIATAAGTGGAVMPPVMGAGVFIMAEVTGIPLLRILLYSLLPAVLYFGSVYAYIDIKSRRRGIGAMAIEGSPPSVWRTVGRGIHLLLPLLFLMYLLARDYSPFYASSASAVALWLVSQLRAETRLDLRYTLLALEVTTREALTLSATSAIAAAVLGIITISGLMLKVTAVTLALAGGSLLLALFIVAVISSVLGMGLPVTSAYIIVSTLGAPALTELGLSLLAAHLVIFWFAQTATITPPVCMTAFVAARLADAPPMRTGFEALRVAIGLYLIPLMFAYTNLLSGNWLAMFFDAAAGMLWLITVTMVIEGYFRGILSWWQRAVITAAGAAFFVSTFDTTVTGTAGWLAAGVTCMVAVWIAQSRRGAMSAPAGSPGTEPPCGREAFEVSRR
jgi:TRAP transporter 4TM/12TM fusion protein